ncbi:MAG TPA: TAT-variant-translocated molybdopterin oxidoreductase [Vicinamibacterales bacterium]|jgi:molybdopterin-containing oxidoreductase family iron-sulfur binding subunit
MNPEMKSQPVYWKSLEELRKESRRAVSDRDEFAEPLPWKQGTPPSSTPNGPSRRDFLTLMGFTLGAAGCSRAATQHALPFVTAPEDLTPGVPNWYASTCGGCSTSCSVLVKVRDGRPIKIEGNAEAPLFGGGTCATGQASVLSLYDGARLKGPSWRGVPTDWQDIDDRIESHLQATMARRGRVVLLSGTITSPSTRDLIARWSRHYDRFQHIAYDPVSYAGIRRAHQMCFDKAVIPHYRFDRAAVIVGVEADFLGTWLSPVEFTAQYARGRRPSASMAHHVQFESTMTLTGANADVRHPLAPSEVGRLVLSLLDRVERHDRSRVDPPQGITGSALDAIANRLRSRRGESLVVCGVQDEAVQTIVARLNHVLGNVGRTFALSPSSLQKQGDEREVAALIAAMRRGEIDALILYGVNPAYDHPDSDAFLEGLARVPLSVSFADRVDETAAHVHAVCPDHHSLEAWGDAEPVTGVFSLMQPAINPLFDTRAAQESLLAWLGEPSDWRHELRSYWQRNLFPLQSVERDFDAFWDSRVQAGFLRVPVPAQPSPEFVGDLDAAVNRIREDAFAAARGADDYELHVYETVALRDGRHANNPWLQELPDPISRLTWGHGLAIAPAAADRLGFRDGDVVTLIADAHRVDVPIWRQPGQSANTVSIAVGYGRTQCGPVGNGVGVNAVPLLRQKSGRRSRVVRLEKTGRSTTLAATQTHHSTEGRPVFREATLATFLAAGGRQESAESTPSLWAEHQPGSHTWGLAIDLNACTGCSACVVACQAENNVPVVGKDEVARSREMHWIRIDRYYQGKEAAPEVLFQPVMCQHCANAPCETVCPVLATVHSADGINEQVYNRCIGTRYCENNCPYKVRRFNWFRYANNARFDFNMNSPLGTMVLNPDVVVRSRGVMEKCSLCVQRIQAGKTAAALSGGTIVDGQIQTACQQACPAKAIVFGDAQDPRSAFARLRHSPRHYHLLEELGTRPGVGYLTKIRNREA